jgi:hypothetical protein
VADVGFAAEIEDVVGAWDGVTAEPHRFGGVEFRVGKRELGHLHGDHLADFPFTVKLRDELIDVGRVERHRILPDSGWASRRIGDEEDVADVIELFRLQYERTTSETRSTG